MNLASREPLAQNKTYTVQYKDNKKGGQKTVNNCGKKKYKNMMML